MTGENSCGSKTQANIRSSTGKKGLINRFKLHMCKTDGILQELLCANPTMGFRKCVSGKVTSKITALPITPLYGVTALCLLEFGQKFLGKLGEIVLR